MTAREAAAAGVLVAAGAVAALSPLGAARGAGGAPVWEAAAVIARAAPSVVRIEVAGSGRPRAAFARRVLLRAIAPREGGAGVVVDRDLVVTHATLAADAAPRFVVVTGDGARVAATLARLDLDREVAVLRTAGPLAAPPARLDAGAGLAPGHHVVALGDPFGVARDGRGTATLGVLEGRTTLQTDETLWRGEVLLTSAAVNPGSEGGALLDLEGRVVGLVCPLARDRRSGALHGHALPVAAFAPVIEAARRGGGALGLTGRPGAGGVVVERVAQDGPAARAGLRPGDVLVAVGGQPAPDPAALGAALGGRHAGETVRVEVERDGARRAVDVVLGAEVGGLGGVAPPAQAEGGGR